ncbi:germin-like protein 9-3 [Zingiber officinale]|uniref:germin-like protein 9-3 n=1 Tax=Zingiber officinale TaxID=94328 RepID=UPI001C4B3DE4|nr:germin-like protein 9-3 [Zingiber officinale]
MALNKVLFLMLLAFAISHVATASGSDITSDFILPPNVTAVDGSFFTYTGLRSVVNSPPGAGFSVSKAAVTEFPALLGQSVSMAVLKYPAGSVNPPHTHPRSAELLFLVHGYLEVGFVDTGNKLFTRSLQPGDVFVFPKGLIHYQYCNSGSAAVAVSAFGSANAGTVSVPMSVFATGVDDVVLAKSFKTHDATIQELVRNLGRNLGTLIDSDFVKKLLVLLSLVTGIVSLILLINSHSRGTP